MSSWCGLCFAYVCDNTHCRKCDVNRQDGKYGALHIAVKFFKPKNVKLLVQHGASEVLLVL